jgi:hypothetical protein
VDETSALLMELRLRVIIDNNNAPTVATITLAATEGSDVVFDFTLSNPSADTVYFVQQMVRLEADY